MSVSTIGQGAQTDYKFDLGAKIEKQAVETDTVAAKQAAPASEIASTSQDNERPQATREPGVGNRVDVSA